MDAQLASGYKASRCVFHNTEMQILTPITHSVPTVRDVSPNVASVVQRTVAGTKTFISKIPIEPPLTILLVEKPKELVVGSLRSPRTREAVSFSRCPGTIALLSEPS